jgi:NAD(P)-dependent dehydrogenase (short-subunit alcohol dehydrogenase family)
MPRNLVFVSGASSGIGRALARAVPFDDARVLDISRRGAPGLEHVAADLSDPVGWRTVCERFEREIPGFGGERVVFVHSAGTLEPIGSAGSVDLAAYTRQVLLNSAAPQVLGAAFLAAARHTEAAAHLVMISSGAAVNAYEGWSAYCAGKAAVDHWVRTAGAEEDRRGGGCRVLAVAPGIVETAMQEQIRGSAREDFPEVERFVALHEEGALRPPDAVAPEIWALLERGLPNGSVVDLRDAET